MRSQYHILLDIEKHYSFLCKATNERDSMARELRKIEVKIADKDWLSEYGAPEEYYIGEATRLAYWLAKAEEDVAAAKAAFAAAKAEAAAYDAAEAAAATGKVYVYTLEEHDAAEAGE